MRVLALAVLLAPGAALAAESAATDKCDYRPIAGTVGYSAAILARESHAAAFGAAAFVQDRILPDLVLGSFVVSYKLDTLGPTALLPSFATNAGCPGSSAAGNAFIDERYAMTRTTQTAGTVGFGFKKKWGDVHAAFFYAGNITASRLVTGAFSDSFVAHAVGLQSVYLGLAAPAFGRGDIEGPQSYAYDYIAGVAGGIGNITDVSIGYVGSTGLFANLAVPAIHFDVGAALTERLKELAYLKGGFRDVASSAGVTSVYTKASQLTSGPRVDPSTGNVLENQGTEVQFLTHHLSHRVPIGKAPGLFKDVEGYLEFEAAVATHPAGFLQLVRVGGSHGIFAGSVGYVKPPEMRFLGSEGEGRPFAVLSVRIPLARLPLVGMQLALNDPDILRLFPYSPKLAGSLNFQFHWSEAGFKEMR